MARVMERHDPSSIVIHQLLQPQPELLDLTLEQSDMQANGILALLIVIDTVVALKLAVTLLLLLVMRPDSLLLLLLLLLLV